MIKKKTLLLILLLTIICGFNRPVLSLDQSVLDPLDLSKKNQKVETNITKMFKKAYITAITADQEERALVVTAIPEINSTASLENKVVKIEFPNCSLHKSISNDNYNWSLKLRNQYIDILDADVYRDEAKNMVVVTLKFNKPVKTIIKRISPSKIKYVFEKVNINKDARSPQSSNDDILIKPTKYSFDLKKRNNKPSGSYLTVDPQTGAVAQRSKSNSDNEKLVNNFQTREDEHFPGKKHSSKTEYKQSNFNFKPVKPINNNKSGETNAEVLPSPVEPPVLDDLPPLNGPEGYKNDLNNVGDYGELLKMGMALDAQNRYDDAIQKYSQAIMVNPSRYEAYSAMGDAYLKQQNDNLAIENYEKSLKINPNQPMVIYNLGVAYSNNNENSKAIDCFVKVLQMQPGNYGANYHLANQYYLKTDYKNAITNYEICLGLSKKSKNYIETSKMFYNIANSYRELKQYPKAISNYKDSLKLFREFADAHYNLAATYVDSGDYKQAIAEFEEFKKYTTSKQEIDKADEIISKLKTNE